MADLHAAGGVGQHGEFHRGGGDVDHPLLVFDIEVVVVRGVGVEIGARGIHGHFAQQARFVELVQRIVDGGERHVHPRLAGFAMQLLGADMAMRPAEQQLGQRHALPGRAKAGHAQHGGKAGLARRMHANGLDDTVGHVVLGQAKGRKICIPYS